MIALREHRLSMLTWHLIGVAALFATALLLAILIGVDSAAARTSSVDALARKEVELKVLNFETAPLRTLDKRVAESRRQINLFYAQRIPASYSSIAARIGELQVQSGVRLSQAQYAPGMQSANLSEVSVDAGIHGEYPQIMRFVNGLERDKTFFVIRGMMLTGQQGGTVDLRLRVSSWIRTEGKAGTGLRLPPGPHELYPPSSKPGLGGQ